MSDPAPGRAVCTLDAHGLIFQMYYAVGSMSAPTDGRRTPSGVTRSLMNLYDRARTPIATSTTRTRLFVRQSTRPKAHRDPPPDDLLTQEPMIRK